MPERWRVAIVWSGAAGAEVWRCKRDVAREMRDRTGGAVVVAGAPGSGLIARVSALFESGESPVSAYTDSRAGAEEAARVAQEVTGQHGLAARVSVECWRPAQKRWEDASAVSQRDLAEEHDYQQREDRRLSAETGVAQWRVRAELRTQRDAVALAQRLSSEGHQIGQGRKSVVASADSEDDARRLAEKTRQYAPGAEVHAERADTPRLHRRGLVGRAPGFSNLVTVGAQRDKAPGAQGFEPSERAQVTGPYPLRGGSSCRWEPGGRSGPNSAWLVDGGDGPRGPPPPDARLRLS